MSVSGIALVLCLLAPLTVVTAGADAEAAVPYIEFNRNMFVPTALQIATELTPCGCTANIAPPSFTFEGVTPPYVTFKMLRSGMTDLLDYMRDLLLHCSCGDGIQTIDAAADSNFPDTADSIPSASATQFVNSITNTLGQVMGKCCDASQSVRTFQFVTGSFTFAEAVANAQERGGKVAVINSRQDSMKATLVLRAAGASTASNAVSTPNGIQPYVWIGLQRENSVWHWQDGSQYGAFTNWGYEQPQDGRNCGGFCVASSANYFSTWAAINCSVQRLSYILDVPGESSAEQASDTTIILAVIGVLVGLFVIAVVFIILKRFVPAFRDRKIRGRRVAASHTTERARSSRRSRRSVDTDDNPDEAEDLAAAEAAVGVGGQAAHPPTRRRRRRVTFPGRDEGPEAGNVPRSQTRQRTASHRSADATEMSRQGPLSAPATGGAQRPAPAITARASSAVLPKAPSAKRAAAEPPVAASGAPPLSASLEMLRNLDGLDIEDDLTMDRQTSNNNSMLSARSSEGKDPTSPTMDVIAAEELGRATHTDFRLGPKNRNQPQQLQQQTRAGAARHVSEGEASLEEVNLEMSSQPAAAAARAVRTRHVDAMASMEASLGGDTSATGHVASAGVTGTTPSPAFSERDSPRE
jgi:hypothetical protein